MSVASSETDVAAKSVIRWSPWLAVVFVIAVYLLSQIVGGILISIYPGLKHWSSDQTNDWINNSVWAQFFYVLVAEGFTVGALYAFLKRYKLSFASIGLTKPRWSDPLKGLAMLVPYYIVYLVTVAVVQKLLPSVNVDQAQQLGFNNVHGFGPLFVTFISLVILPPFVEELLVRGYLYTSLRARYSKLIATVVASIIFASGHLQFGSGAPLLWIAAIDTFVLSLFLIYLREHTGRLYASMTLHALKNFIAFVALFIAKVH